MNEELLPDNLYQGTDGELLPGVVSAQRILNVPTLELEWREQFAKMSNMTGANDLRREIVVTPFNGNYGVAGYILVVNGSPPHGQLIVTFRQGPLSMVLVGLMRTFAIRHDPFGPKSHQRLWDLTQRLLHLLNYPTSRNGRSF